MRRISLDEKIAEQLIKKEGQEQRTLPFPEKEEVKPVREGVPGSRLQPGQIPGNIALGDIKQAYVGKPGTCMCGCAGNYYYTSANTKIKKANPEAINDAKVLKIYNKLKANQGNIDVMDNGDEVIYTVDVGQTQYTMYVKKSSVTAKLKKTAEETGQEEYFEYLDDLRESGETNMFGARPYLMAEFELDKQTAAKILVEWMKTFSQRHPKARLNRKLNKSNKLKW